MFTASAKIRKPGGAQPDEFEQSMSQVFELFSSILHYFILISMPIVQR